MGAWADLTLAAATLKGLAPVDLLDPDSGLVDTARATTEMVAQAKRHVQTRITAELPRMVNDADGPIEFLDAASGLAKTHIDDLLQEMLGYAFLMLYYEQEGLSRQGVYSQKAELAAHRFEGAFHAFSRVIVLDEDFITASEATTDNWMNKYSHPIFIG
jgi:hypothetical protein